MKLTPINATLYFVIFPPSPPPMFYSDPNTLFRGNSLASKLIDESMKVVGQSYLQRTLQSCIDEIFEAQKPCEIDSSRLTENDNVDINKVEGEMDSRHSMLYHLSLSLSLSLSPFIRLTCFSSSRRY